MAAQFRLPSSKSHPRDQISQIKLLLLPTFSGTMSADCNLNWLLHKMFLIRDYDFCKKLIEQQMEQNLNQEYLFFVKVCKRVDLIKLSSFMS